MYLWAAIALVIAIASAWLGFTGWSSPATPFLAGLAVIFALISFGAISTHLFRH